MAEPLLRLLLMLRFLCFVAVVYLMLHVVFSRLISKPDSKVLWFFSVLTTPLTWPVRMWLAPNSSEPRLRATAILVYGLVWTVILVVTQAARLTLR